MMFPHEVLMVKFLFAFAMVVLPVNAGATNRAHGRSHCRRFVLVAGRHGHQNRVVPACGGTHRPERGAQFQRVPGRGLTLTVPLGWSVVMHFRNHDGMLPHSPRSSRTPIPFLQGQLRPLSPALSRSGWSRDWCPSRPMTFALLRIRGSYLIFCGVPGHGAAGMWVRLAVSAQLPGRHLAATPAGKTLASQGTRSQGGGLRFAVSVHTTVGEKPDE